MNVKSNKGSITVFVLVGLLFMSAFLIISYGNIVNKSKIAKEQMNLMSEIYSYNDGDANAYERAYTELRKGTKQPMSSSSESSTLELTKTFADDISNLRIYGENSLQDGTPSPENPVEVQSVGDLANLFNPNATLEKVGAYLGINTTGIDKNYTLKIRLKEGKTVPTGVYFGFVYYKTETSTGASANWIISKGTLNSIYGDGTSYALTAFNPSENYSSGICCYSGTQDVWNNIMDAFEITWVEGTYTAENMPEYVEYGKYKIPIKVSGNDVESQSFNIYLDEPLRKVGDVADYIDFGTGTVVRKIKELTLDGNASWESYYQTTYAHKYYGFRIKNVLDAVYSKIEGLSNMSQYIGSYYTNTYKDALWIGNGDNNIYFLFTDYYDSTLDDDGLSNFKARLNEVPLRIYYESKTELPTETVELGTLMTFEDYTKIEVLTEVAPSKIEVEYTGYTFE